ncbi:MAG: hypothetical protein U5K77_03620 [Candidatus Saccharibacteria bacterium]|nr:hypothetical protein [Candidatus Saccharibacteria bacterium]
MAKKDKTKVAVDNGPMGYVLFVAWIGAFAYFLQTSGILLRFTKINSAASLIEMYYLFELLKVA